MNDGYVAGNEYDACLCVVAGNRIFRIPEFLIDPRPNFLMKFCFTEFGLSGVGVADIVFRIERQSAVLCECVGSGCEQREKDQMFQNKKLNW